MKHGFTEKQLASSGFRPDADGVWRKAGREDVPGDDPGTVPDVEQGSKRGRKRSGAAKKRGAGSLLRSPVGIIVTSHRVRADDPDGLAPKWWIDSLHAHGIIEDDSRDHVAWVRFQCKKCRLKSEQRTEIEVVELSGLSEVAHSG